MIYFRVLRVVEIRHVNKKPQKGQVKLGKSFKAEAKKRKTNF